MRLYRLSLTGALLCYFAYPTFADSTVYNNLTPNNMMAMASRPSSAGKIEIEAADDFVLTQDTTLSSGSFVAEIREKSPAVVATSAARGKCSVHSDKRLPTPGTELVREYKGRQIRVRVLADGFECENRVYGSLSAIAREVARCNWNGFAFFKLNGALR